MTSIETPNEKGRGFPAFPISAKTLYFFLAVFLPDFLAVDFWVAAFGAGVLVAAETTVPLEDSAAFGAATAPKETRAKAAATSMDNFFMCDPFRKEIIYGAAPRGQPVQRNHRRIPASLQAPTRPMLQHQQHSGSAAG